MRIIPFSKTCETKKQQNFRNKVIDEKSLLDFLKTLPTQKQKMVLEQLVNPDTVMMIKNFEDYNGREPLFSIIKASEIDPNVKKAYEFRYESPYYLIARYPGTNILSGINPLYSTDENFDIIPAFLGAGHLLEMNKNLKAWAINKAEELETIMKVLKDVIGELNLGARKIKEAARRIDSKKIEKVLKIEAVANNAATDAASAIVKEKKMLYIDPKLEEKQALEIRAKMVSNKIKSERARLKAEETAKKLTNLNEAIKNAQTPEKKLELKFKKFLLTVNALPMM